MWKVFPGKSSVFTCFQFSLLWFLGSSWTRMLLETLRSCPALSDTKNQQPEFKTRWCIKTQWQWEQIKHHSEKWFTQGSKIQNFTKGSWTHIHVSNWLNVLIVLFNPFNFTNMKTCKDAYSYLLQRYRARDLLCWSEEIHFLNVPYFLSCCIRNPHTAALTIFY